jgi:hypothetical protein
VRSGGWERYTRSLSVQPEPVFVPSLPDMVTPVFQGCVDAGNLFGS